MKSALLACAFAGVSAAVAPSTVQSTLTSLWQQARSVAGNSARPHEVFSQFLQAAHTFTHTHAAALTHTLTPTHTRGGVHARMTQPSVFDNSHSYYPNTPEGYYGIIPEFLTSVSGSATWSSACLNANSATTGVSADGKSVTITVTSSGLNASAPLCSDFYLFGTVDGIDLLIVNGEGVKNVTLPVARSQWFRTFGVRVFRFIHDPLTTISDAINTISLFVPSLTEPTLDQGSMNRNAQFLRDYVGLNIVNRTAGTIDMDWSYVQSGDLFVVARLDGLGTMEQWGTGAASTHIVMGMRFGSNQDLYIVESTAKDAYWPLDNIQMNPINTWLPMAEAAAYSIVHLPLSDAIRASLNITAAQNFILDNLGFPYGYHNFVNTFFDTAHGNLPWPASIEFIEIVANLLEMVDRNITDQIFADALNMRLGTTGLDLATCALEAAGRNMSFGDLVAVPEQDDWVYSDGPSMVCDVFYCNVLKAGGAFGSLTDTITCREFHNADVYQLTFYNLTKPRPQVCIDADPDLPYCQIMGPIKLELPGVNARQPYPYMSQHCSQLPLDYTRTPSGC